MLILEARSQWAPSSPLLRRSSSSSSLSRPRLFLYSSSSRLLYGGALAAAAGEESDGAAPSWRLRWKRREGLVTDLNLVGWAGGNPIFCGLICALGPKWHPTAALRCPEPEDHFGRKILFSPTNNLRVRLKRQTAPDFSCNYGPVLTELQSDYKWVLFLFFNNILYVFTIHH